MNTDLLTDDVVLLLEVVVGVLTAATIAGFLIAKLVRGEASQPTIRNLNARIGGWWVMIAIFAIALATGPAGSIILFGLISFQALREFMGLTPVRTTDHGTLLLVFFIAAPLQYALLYHHWYGFYSIMIPVFGFLLLPARSVLAGDAHDFLVRAATVQWALMACVYCISYVPAILQIDVVGGTRVTPGLLLFLVIVVQLSDVFQYIWGKLVGRHRIAPTVSPNKTWEGLVLGGACATASGAGIYWATPFSPLAAIGMSMVIVLMGFLGGLVMSAIKRDRGVKDFGTIISGHGGVLDRVDSLIFAAPVFFHLVRYYY